MEAQTHPGQEVAPALARGRYRLVEVLGSGGMATVYRAHDTLLGTPVAVKVLHPALATSSTLRARFVQEARTMARLRHHANVVFVHDFGQDPDDQRMFIAMELMRGSLQARLERKGSLPPRVAVEVIDAVLAAIEAAHSRHIVHRDIKPSNILLTAEGVPKVSDFGIARILDGGSSHKLTRSGAGVGTWAFMAPEQKRDAATVDTRADIYGVGATLFALITNKEPHDIDREDVWAEELAVLPGALADLIRKATHYKPDERYASAADMRQALQGCRALLPPNPPGAEALLITTLVPQTSWAPPSLPPLSDGTHHTHVPPSGPTSRTGTRTWPPREPRGLAPWVIAVAVGAVGVVAVWWTGVLQAPRPTAIALGQVVLPEPAPAATPDPATRAPPPAVQAPAATAAQPAVQAPPVAAAPPGETAKRARKAEGGPPAVPPAPPVTTVAAVTAPPATYRIKVLFEDIRPDADCRVLVDNAVYLKNGTPLVVSKNSTTPLDLTVGVHRVGCKDGAMSTIEVKGPSTESVRIATASAGGTQ